MTTAFSPLMAIIYRAISDIVLFWHAAWHRLLGDPLLVEHHLVMGSRHRFPRAYCPGHPVPDFREAD